MAFATEMETSIIVRLAGTAVRLAMRPPRSSGRPGRRLNTLVIGDKREPPPLHEMAGKSLGSSTEIVRFWTVKGHNADDKMPALPPVKDSRVLSGPEPMRLNRVGADRLKLKMPGPMLKSEPKGTTN